MIKQINDSEGKVGAKKPRKNLSKVDIIAILANSAGVPRYQAKKALDGVIEVVSSSIAKGVSVRFHGLGVFYPHRSPPRKGRNPHTGESVDIPQRKSMKFRATKKLRDIA